MGHRDSRRLSGEWLEPDGLKSEERSLGLFSCVVAGYGVDTDSVRTSRFSRLLCISTASRRETSSSGELLDSCRGITGSGCLLRTSVLCWLPDVGHKGVNQSVGSCDSCEVRGYEQGLQFAERWVRGTIPVFEHWLTPDRVRRGQPARGGR